MIPPTHTFDSVVVGDTWLGAKLTLQTVSHPINLTGMTADVGWKIPNAAGYLKSIVTIENPLLGEVVIVPQKFSAVATHSGYIEIRRATGEVLTYARLILPVIKKTADV